jgi:hypothetical protein
MANENRLRPGHRRYDEAMALEMTARTTRNGQGKKNPEDFPKGTPESDAATDDFLRDLLLAMGDDPDR